MPPAPSSTSSPPSSPTSQPIDAQRAGAASRTLVLVAHGQPSAPAPPERDLAQLAMRVAGFLPDWQVHSATLALADRLEQVMQPGALVYPFFMADGWFTTQVLPQRLSGIDHHQLPPFGQDPNLPMLAAGLVQQSLAAQNQPARHDSLLLAAHGSARGPKAAAATEAFATRLRPLLPKLQLLTAYIEQDPYLFDVALKMQPHDLCLPFFAQSGDHVIDDIPNALDKAKFRGTLLPALGTAPGVAGLIAQAIQRF